MVAVLFVGCDYMGESLGLFTLFPCDCEYVPYHLELTRFDATR